MICFSFFLFSADISAADLTGQSQPDCPESRTFFPLRELRAFFQKVKKNKHKIGTGSHTVLFLYKYLLYCIQEQIRMTNFSTGNNPKDFLS